MSQVVLHVHLTGCDWTPSWFYCNDCHIGYVLGHCRRQKCGVIDTGDCLHCKAVYLNGELIKPPIPMQERNVAAIRNHEEEIERLAKLAKKKAKKRA